VLRDLLQTHASDSESSALPLRLMGAVHHLVLEGNAPALAKFYPSAGGAVGFEDAWRAFVDTVREQIDQLRTLILSPVQTNDVGRSGSLLGGFGLIAEQTGLPLRLLEIGASAGLNLRWDRYRYEWAGGGWGDATSPVCLENVFVDMAPSLPSKVNIIERAGCDLSPVDVNSDSGRLTLLSCVWADQIDRIRRLKRALEIADVLPCAVEKAHAGDWLEERLRVPHPGAATVVFHSAVWKYISAPEQQRIIGIIADAGERACEEAPLAWLKMEPGDATFEVRLRIYPGFDEQVIATTRLHTPSVRWLRKRSIKCAT